MELDLGRAAEQILGPVLAEQGFTVDGYAPSSITFRDERRSIALSYYPEDPTPLLNVVLGLRMAGEEVTAALWQLYPELPELSAVENAQLSSPETLDARLTSIRDGWLPSLIWPSFEEPERFQRAFRTRRDKWETDHEAGILKQRLRQARAAYDRGDFATTVEQLTLVGLAQLSAADRRRYVLARRELEPGS